MGPRRHNKHVKTPAAGEWPLGWITYVREIPT
jgi:hypothetical protein